MGCFTNAKDYQCTSVGSDWSSYPLLFKPHVVDSQTCLAHWYAHVSTAVSSATMSVSVHEFVREVVQRCSDELSSGKSRPTKTNPMPFNNTQQVVVIYSRDIKNPCCLIIC